MADDDWICVAYGEQPGAEAACFFTEHGRVCHSLTECDGSVAAERQRVWRKIQEGAAAGDEMMVYLAANLDGPDQLLNGPGVEPQT